ncbi:hypothetical protein CLV78_110142 [Aliiruegeria haliotis]|uniref:G domain-containing protein n=1 Tax=Aliiruegeria haliotis TaxID=1280846 RepID=A0A2T0RJH5_9RHOB|nr:GTPase [Aliiruegeria haliotis]PRY21267.1 hypothetical protein CLV78_110142 [Aliiruegeria haliotis]
MRQRRRIRELLLKAEVVLAIVGVGLPLLAVFVLGWVWLRENGLLLSFVATLAGFVVLVAIIHRALGAQSTDDTPQPSADLTELQVAPDPEWNDRQKTAYEAVCAHIAEKLVDPIEDVGAAQDLAASVIETAARQFEDSRRDCFDATLPEFLLFTEQVPSRYRRILKKHVPYIDAISLYRPAQAWRNRQSVKNASKIGTFLWRGQRFLTNPVHGVISEVWKSSQDYLLVSVSRELQLEMQRALFEVVGQVAVDLYSDNLRLSDQELLEIQLQEIAGDRRRLARPDSALRVAFVGQISSGKSSLINALTGEDIAEVDVLPTTDAPTIHEVLIEDASFRILDTPGLDGSTKVSRRVAVEAADADIVVWVLRANRPSREIDRIALALFHGHFENEPERLEPPVLFVLTFMDKLAPNWPYAEHELPRDVREAFENACNAAAKELEIQRPIPASTGAISWNIAPVRRALIGLYADGLKTQRNRARREATAGGIASNLKRSGSGAWEVMKAGARIAKKGVSGDDGSNSSGP